MKCINLDLNPLLLFTTDDKKHSFYEDVLPSERVEASGVCLANFECDIDDNIDKEDKPPKLTLTKNNSKKLEK